jgi:hypothetical protein
MGFPATSTFQSATGPVDVTVTAHPETGHPHMVHFSTDAGLCAHFLVREWNQVNEHLQALIEDGKRAKTDAVGLMQIIPPAVPAQRDQNGDDPEPSGQGAPVSPDQPFLPPTATAAEVPEGGEKA